MGSSTSCVRAEHRVRGLPPPADEGADAPCALHPVRLPGERHGARRLRLWRRARALDCRVHLEPGECRTVSFVLSTEHLSYIGADLRRVVEPGRVSVQVGTSSVDLPLAAELLLRGPVFELVERSHYLTTSTIE